ncbi:MAG: hypothetical protein U9Q20_02795 [Campylobacterota bacterium]|nr:hypothetical protein [Campylobacterota bacterium]
MKKFIHILLLFIIIALSGCSNGGGVVGDYLDDDSSSSSIQVDTNSTTIDQLDTIKQLELMSEVYSTAYSKSNSLDLKTIKRTILRDTELESYLLSKKENYSDLKNNILKEYNLETKYVDHTSTYLSGLYDGIKSQINDSSTENEIFDLLAKAEEYNIENITKNESSLGTIYATTSATVQENFVDIIDKIYENDEIYTPTVLTYDKYSEIIDLSNKLGDNTLDNITISSIYGDFNTTKILLTNNSDKPLYINDSVLQDSLFYITKQKELSLLLMSSFKSFPSASSYSTLLNLIYEAENTHLVALEQLIEEYGLSFLYDSYSNESLNTIIDGISSSTPYTSEYTDVFSSLIDIENRYIQDLESYKTKNSDIEDINELYDALILASQSHKNSLTDYIYSTDLTDIKVDIYLDTNSSISKINISNNSNKIFEIPENEKQDLFYMLYFETKALETCYDINATSICQAKDTTLSNLTRFLDYFSIEDEYSIYKNDGIDGFFNIVDESTYVNTRERQKELLFIEEQRYRYFYQILNNNSEYLNSTYLAMFEDTKNSIKHLAESMYGAEDDEDEDRFYYSPATNDDIFSSDVYDEIVGELGELEISPPVVIDDGIPSYKYYSTNGVYDTTQITIATYDISKKPYYTGETYQTTKYNLSLISQLVNITKDIYEDTKNILENDSVYTSNNTYIKNLTSALFEANTKQNNTYDTVLDLLDATNLDLSNANELNVEIRENIKPITSEIEYISLLNSLAKLEERKLCDLNNLYSDNIPIVNELFDRTENASLNHLSMLINSINDAQSSGYSFQIITDTQSCGTGIESKLSNIVEGSNDDELDIYFYVESNGISRVSVEQKPYGGELNLPDTGEMESIYYFDELFSRINEESDDNGFYLTATYKTITDMSLIQGIKNTFEVNKESIEDTKDIYGLTLDINETNSYDTSIENYIDIVFNQMDSSDTNDTKNDKNYINILSNIQERIIYDLQYHIDNIVNNNKNIVNIYKALQKASINHLVILNNIYLGINGEDYKLQLITQEDWDTYITDAQDDGFLRGP